MAIAIIEITKSFEIRQTNEIMQVMHQSEQYTCDVWRESDGTAWVQLNDDWWRVADVKGTWRTVTE